MRFEPGEKFSVADHAVLDDLSIARQQLTVWQGCERAGIGQHQDRLMKGPHQILALRRVDRGLAADRTVDLCQQGGWNLHVIDAAQQRCGGKAGKIADHAAPQSDQRGAALDAERQYVLAQFGEMGEILGLLAGRQNNFVMRDVRRIERRDQRGEM